MLDALKFVKGAVAKKDFVPELTHFRITGGRVTGYNGVMALSAPIATDLEASPKALLFYRAIEACEGPVSLSLTEANRLVVKSGRMRAAVPCIEQEGYFATPQGDRFPVLPGFRGYLETVAPFIGEDASRPWSLGVMFLGPFLYATNNVCVIQHWTGVDMPPVHIPKFAVDQLLRSPEDPSEMQTDGKSLTFHFADGRWLRTQLYDEGWPAELITGILDRTSPNAEPVPELLFDSVERLYPFLEGKASQVFLNEGSLSSDADSNGADAISFEVPGLAGGPSFSIHQLRLLNGVATKIDFSTYPGPCTFYGDRLRGVVLGMNR
jgi:hypothetical protein